MLDVDRGFCWAAPAACWRRMRVTRARAAGVGTCDHCVATGDDLARCCATASYCDAACADAAWLFSHRRNCPRRAPLGAGDDDEPGASDSDAAPNPHLEPD